MVEEEWLAEDAEIFSVLASQTRLQILEHAYTYRYREQDAITYAELKERVGIEDSGKFNYHLDKLRGRFLKEAVPWNGSGYVPKQEAKWVGKVIREGRFRGTDVDPVELEASCPICGERLEVGHDWNFYVGCGSCFERYRYHDVPPTVVEDHDDLRALMMQYDRANRREADSFLDGFCPECGGEPRFWFSLVVDPYAESTLHDLNCGFACDTCHHSWGGTIGRYLLSHPGVRAYCEDYGIALEAEPFWEYDWVLTDLMTRIRSQEPWEVEKVATVDGCRLNVVFDEEGEVEAITHVDLDPTHERFPENSGTRKVPERPSIAD